MPGAGRKTQDRTKEKKKKEQRQELRWRHSDTKRRSDNEDCAARAAWKVAEVASCFWRFSIGTTYLALAIVPPRPLVTQTNKTARTYHRGAVSDLGLNTAVFLKLDQVVEWIPWPCAGEGGRETQRVRMRRHGGGNSETEVGERSEVKKMTETDIHERKRLVETCFTFYNILSFIK